MFPLFQFNHEHFTVFALSIILIHIKKNSLLVELESIVLGYYGTPKGYKCFDLITQNTL